MPADFLSLPGGNQPPSGSVNVGNFTWATNVTTPFMPAYARSALVWTYQAVSTHRLNIVAPPWSGPAPLQVPPSPSCLLSNLSELRLVVAMGYRGGSGLAAGDIFTGFWFNDWGAFQIGSAAAPWLDNATNSYIGLVINRTAGLTQVMVKRAGVVSRVVLATLPSIAEDVPFLVDHRFYQATMTTAARYVLRVNGELIVEFSFSSADAPVYSATYDGIAPALFGSYWDVGGNLRHEHILSLDCLAGPGANDFPLG